MEIQVNKKTKKIIIGVVVLIVLIIVGVFAVKAISTNMKISETKKKLSKIDVEEFEKALVEELEKTELKVETSSDEGEEDRIVITEFFEGVNFKGYISGATMFFKDGEPIAGIEYPCFKINSDSNGKFKNIEYTQRVMDTYIIEETVEKVLKEKYDVDMKIVGNTKYNIKFNKYLKDFKYTNQGSVWITDQNFFLGVINLIGGYDFDYGEKVSDTFKEYKTVTFGIDF